MSYQNSGPDGPMPTSSVSAEADRKHWKYVMVAFFLGMTGLLAVGLSYSGNGASTGSSVMKFQTSASKSSSSSGLMRYGDKNDDELDALFEDFKTTFSRKYESDEEEAQRYDNFLAFLAKVDERNDAEATAGGTAVHGITKFSDHTDDELKSIKGFVKPSGDIKAGMEESPTPERSTKSSGSSVNWAGVYTTPVKNQGYCGSCWAFSVTEQIESDSIRAGYLTTDDTLSPQQIVSCDKTCDGCDGGSPTLAYSYIEKTGGLESESDYPYESYYGSTGTCDSDSKDYEVTVEKYYYYSSEDDMETHVLETGPLSICIDAETWASYTDGVLSTCGDSVDHCVQAVGINSEEDYWVVRNSWGTDWGKEGYIYLKSGVNLCDITYIPTYTSTSKV